MSGPETMPRETDRGPVLRYLVAFAEHDRSLSLDVVSVVAIQRHEVLRRELLAELLPGYPFQVLAAVAEPDAKQSAVALAFGAGDVRRMTSSPA